MDVAVPLKSFITGPSLLVNCYLGNKLYINQAAPDFENVILISIFELEKYERSIVGESIVAKLRFKCDN